MVHMAHGSPEQRLTHLLETIEEQSHRVEDSVGADTDGMRCGQTRRLIPSQILTFMIEMDVDKGSAATSSDRPGAMRSRTTKRRGSKSKFIVFAVGQKERRKLGSGHKKKSKA